MHSSRVVVRQIARLGLYWALITASAGCHFFIDEPQAESVRPDTGSPGTTVNVHIEGKNFNTKGTLEIDGGGVAISGVSVFNDENIYADLTIAINAPLGSRRLSYTAHDGTDSVPFTIAVGKPTLSSISPNTLQAGTSVTATLNGTNFVSVATPSARLPVEVSDVSVVNNQSMTARLTAGSTTPLGTYDIFVRNGADSSNAVPLTVTAPRPVVKTLTPMSGTAGTTLQLAFGGEGFVTDATTVALSGSGATISNTRVSGGSIPTGGGTGDALAATLTLSVTATPGPRTMTVSTSGGSTEFPFVVLPVLLRPVIGQFIAQPSTILRGLFPSTLIWFGVSNATQCTITPDVGDVPCSSGSRQVSPGVTVEYKLTVRGAGGQEWAYTTVNVENFSPGNVSANGTAIPIVPRSRSLMPIETGALSGQIAGLFAVGAVWFIRIRRRG